MLVGLEFTKRGQCPGRRSGLENSGTIDGDEHRCVLVRSPCSSVVVKDLSGDLQRLPAFIRADAMVEVKHSER